MSTLSGIPSSLTNDSKFGNAVSAVPVYSATNYVPAVLSNPLSVRAAVLRKPELFEEPTPELVEEGDILFDVLANPMIHPQLANAREEGMLPSTGRSNVAAFSIPGVVSALALPSSVGQHFVGEPFRAFLSFHNAATYPLSSLMYRIECTNPSQRRTMLVEQESPRLDAKGNASFKVELLLLESGQHTLQVNVTYTDIVSDQKRMTWASSFQVGRAITEVRRTLHIVPILPQANNTLGTRCSSELSSSTHTLTDVVSNITLPTRKYILSFALQNSSSVPLTLTSVSIHAGEAFEVVPPPKRVRSLPAPGTSASGDEATNQTRIGLTATCPRGAPIWWPLSAGEPRDGGDAFRSRYTGGGSDALEELHLRPKDVRWYTFELLLRPDRLRGLPVCHSASSGSVTSAVPTSLTEAGCVEWKWRRANGDGGTERSRAIRLGRLTAQPSLEMFVLAVHPEVPKAGEPMSMECVAVNYDAERRVDLALRVRPEQLRSEMLLYAGPLVSPLGFVEPRAALTFRVALVPWRAGWVTIQGGLELCDARAPERRLWPLPPITAQPPPLSAAAALEVTEAPEQPFPPVLCEVLVF